MQEIMRGHVDKKAVSHVQMVFKNGATVKTLVTHTLKDMKKMFVGNDVLDVVILDTINDNPQQKDGCMIVRPKEIVTMVVDEINQEFKAPSEKKIIGADGKVIEKGGLILTAPEPSQPSESQHPVDEPNKQETIH